VARAIRWMPLTTIDSQAGQHGAVLSKTSRSIDGDLKIWSPPNLGHSVVACGTATNDDAVATTPSPNVPGPPCLADINGLAKRQRHRRPSAKLPWRLSDIPPGELASTASSEKLLTGERPNRPI